MGKRRSNCRPLQFARVRRLVMPARLVTNTAATTSVKVGNSAANCHVDGNETSNDTLDRRLFNRSEAVSRTPPRHP